jgi:anthranilate synthase/aminodeoxychorismate synthase-like glutamine amidotransferase
MNTLEIESGPKSHVSKTLGSKYGEGVHRRYHKPMVFVLDNYDSFTYNLVQYMGELGAEVVVKRNDELTPQEILALNPDHILLSPGPCTPQDAGILIPLIKEIAAEAQKPNGRAIPTLGVCLGHQAIGAAFGGEVIRAPQLMHGKTSVIEHDGRTIFLGIPQSMTCTRYHSLIVREDSVPEELEVSARVTGESTIMALRHKMLPIEGVQFHPESVLTDHGKQLIANFLKQ